MHYFINRLVNKAIERSQLQRVDKLKLKTQWSPDIAISRDPGSGGAIIAKKLTKKLGWQLFDKEYIVKLSEEMGIPAQEITHIDEHDRTWTSDLLNSMFNPNYVSDVRYITQLKKLLTHAAKEKNLVILGRGANLILPSNMCLCVRVTASLQTRIDNTYKFENKKTKKEASDWVSHVESQRNNFIRQYFGVNPHNPWHYDLVLNTDYLTLDQATNIIFQAFKTKFPKV